MAASMGAVSYSDARNMRVVDQLALLYLLTPEEDE